MIMENPMLNTKDARIITSNEDLLKYAVIQPEVERQFGKLKKEDMETAIQTNFDLLKEKIEKKGKGAWEKFLYGEK